MNQILLTTIVAACLYIPCSNDSQSDSLPNSPLLNRNAQAQSVDYLDVLKSEVTAGFVRIMMRVLFPKQYHIVLAYQYLEGGAYDKALCEYSLVIDIDNKSAEAHYMIARIYRETGEMDKALPEIKMAVMIEPNNATYILNYGMVLISVGQYVEAADAIHKAMLIDPNTRPMGHLLLADIYIRNMKYYDAQIEIATALKLAPTDWQIYDYAGGQYAQMKRYDDAISAFKNAIELNKTCIIPYISAYEAMESAGKKQEGIMILLEYKKLFPNDNNINDYLNGI